MHVEQNFIAQIGPADAKGNHRIDPILQRRAELLQPVDRLGRVEMSFGDVGELREQDLFRRAVFRQVSLHFSRRSHMLDGCMRLVDLAANRLDFAGSDFSFTNKILIFKREAGSSLQNG